MNQTGKVYWVTGAAGFIGSQVVSFLRAQGHRVFCVDLLDHFKTRGRATFENQIDRDALWRELDESEGARWDAIIHLGAISRTSETDYGLLYRQNLRYSQLLFEKAAQKECPFIYASSAATYGNLGFQGGREEDCVDREEELDLLQPLNLYGKLKHEFDQWVLKEMKYQWSPAERARRRVVGFKFFNVYGPGEAHKGSMASVVFHAYRQIQATGEVKLFRSHHPRYADGEQKRDFIFVQDVVNVIDYARQGLLASGLYNLGTGRARTFLDLVRAVFSAVGVPEKIQWVDTPIAIRHHYQYFTQADMTKLCIQGGYSQWVAQQGGSRPFPFATLEEGVSRYVEWLKSSKGDLF